MSDSAPSDTTTSSTTRGALTIHHDYHSGTTVQGTDKNSPAHTALKAHRSWVWSGYAQAWLLRSSRHRKPKDGAITEMQQVLEGLGYTVERDIDPAVPSVEQQERDLADRMTNRAHRLDARSEKWTRTAEVTRAKADHVFDNIPPGQPMLVDHHGYAADRNRRERAWDNLGKSIEQADFAATLARQADSARHHMGARYSRETVGNRIQDLEARQRDLHRRLDNSPTPQQPDATDEAALTAQHTDTEQAERARTELADVTEQLDYWRGVYAELHAGEAAPGPDTVAVGDWVSIRGLWAPVRRVNTKSVSVPRLAHPAPHPGQREYTTTVEWHKITEYRTTEQMPAAYVEAFNTPGTDRVALVFRRSS
ncbi:DUF3560 domain-containing protein [Saccharothrix isguenensis]